ncbi:hypothetical protein [Actinoplanes sp. DH11]|uniref:hypothetical protein n=1 Tax=Actinoplanes sp. DH11 TaxID=2857011 RepID=UPI001E4596AC|nr:hypothetical protein [Actinoplanes sp. DH11]
MTTTGIALARFAAGSLGLLAGGFWLVMTLLSGDPQAASTGALPIGGGLVLLCWDRLRLPARRVAAAVAMIIPAGLAAGLAVERTVLGGMFGWFAYRGWPFTWLERGAAADSPAEARRLAEASDWAVEPFRLVVDVVLWAYAGLVLSAGVILLVRALRGRRP